MTEKIYFGAGCFWHVQETFDKVTGVIETEVGYMGGDEEEYPNPTYQQVSSDKTGYVEVVKVTYDENVVPFEKILEVFWGEHNPTSLNKQGADVGSHYKAAIFYVTEKQKEISEISKKKEQKKYDKLIVTEILPAKTFFRAEEYHQKYLEKY